MIRRIALAVGFALALAATAGADPAALQAEHIQDIVMLVEGGVPEELVIKHIHTSSFVYELSTEDILRLREMGVSDPIIEAMLDTALQTPPDMSLEAQDRGATGDFDDPDVYISAGYFSPWYQYPYAWGFYYDPFPSCYSMYYYPPFTFHAGWGWYGNCDYYYASYWPSYRWCSPHYWNAACGSNNGWYVAVPRSPNAASWRANEGLPSRRAALPNRSRAVYDRRNVEALRAERLARSLDRVNVRNRSDAGAVGAPAPRGSSEALPTRQPRGSSSSAARVLAPRTLRNAPRPQRATQSQPRNAAPAMGPRSAPRSAAPAAPPRSSAPASAPRSGGRSASGASMPRSR